MPRLRFGSSGVEASFSLFAVFAAALAVFNTWQHMKIASIIPETPDLTSMGLGCAALFLSTVTWAAIGRTLGAGVRIGLALGFLIGHVVFAALTFLPVFVSQAYLLVFGALGGLLTAWAVYRNLSLLLGLCCLAGLLLIPVIWSAIAFVMLALPHANLFTIFFADRMTGPVMLDVLHQRAYVQLIHEFGIPSVGINGLAYHNYHWLVGYPLSTLADITGAGITHIHANMLPGFTGPVLVHGLAVGVVFGMKRVLAGVLALALLMLVYTAGVLVSPTITYGLIFLTPSTAYSIGLAAPMLGLFVWYFSGNLSQIKSWHFLVLGVFVLIVGLAKATTMPQVALLMGALWTAYVLRQKAWFTGTLLATVVIALTASGCLYLIWEILQHSVTRVSGSAAYSKAFLALSDKEQSSILRDVRQTLKLTLPSEKGAITDFERQVFYQSTLGLGLIAMTSILLFSLLGLRGGRKHRMYQVIWLALLLTLGFVIQRTIFGYTTPTQVMYVLLPALVLGLLTLSAVIGDHVPQDMRVGGLGTGAKASLVAAFALVCAGLALGLVHFNTTPYVRSAAMSSAVKNLGTLANPRGKDLIRTLTSQRVSTLGLGGEAAGDWPKGASQYWKTWNQQPAYVLSQRLQQYADQVEGRRVAVFIPGSSDYWEAAKVRDPRATMFWVQGATGLPLYRGKLHRGKKLNKGYKGRGISDFSSEAAALISNESNVFCWDRFKGYQIVSIDLKLIKSC